MSSSDRQIDMLLKLLNQTRTEYCAEILSIIFAGWFELGEQEKEHLARMNNFFVAYPF